VKTKIKKIRGRKRENPGQPDMNFKRACDHADQVKGAVEGVEAVEISVSPQDWEAKGVSLKDHLIDNVYLPVKLNLLIPKEATLRSIGKILDDWQRAWNASGILNKIPARHRAPKTSLFPDYLRAADLKWAGKTYKEIAWDLWRGKNPDGKPQSPDKQIAKAKFYVRNGFLLSLGFPQLVSKRW
jgi:hypothetical protein